MSKKSNSPAVSVLMAVYNARPFLGQAVGSILAQTFSDFEFIIIDDGSSDGSKEVLEHYAVRDERIRLISRPDNRGLTKTLNEGLTHVRAPLVARMDADDIAMPKRLRLQVDYLRRHPSCVLVGGQVLLIDEKGGRACHEELPAYYEDLWKGMPLDHAEIDQSLLIEGWPLMHPAVLMRRDALQEVNGYREQFKVCQDHDLFLRMAEVGRVANLPNVLIKYRCHPSQVTQTFSGKYYVDMAIRDAHRRRGLEMPEDLRFLALKRRLKQVRHVLGDIRGKLRQLRRVPQRIGLL